MRKRTISKERGCLLDRLRKTILASSGPAPHLGRIALLGAEIQRLQLQQQLAAGALDGFGLPAVVVSPEGALLLSNAKAELVMAGSGPYVFSAGKLRLMDPDAQRQFAFAVRRACSDRGVRAALVSVPACTGSPAWTLRVLPLPARLASSESMPCALVYAAPARSAPPPAQVLCQAFGFSPVEAEVAFLLADGLAPKEIAYARQVSMATVRTQIREIFAKAGARRQGQLARMVLGIPQLFADEADPDPDTKSSP